MRIDTDKPIVAFTFPGMTKVKLTKVSELDNAEVPNNIPVNDYRIGYVRDELLIPRVGWAYGLEYVININGQARDPNHWFVTSRVVELLTSENNNPDTIIRFKTLNSIYEIEVQKK